MKAEVLDPRPLQGSVPAGIGEFPPYRLAATRIGNVIDYLKNISAIHQKPVLVIEGGYASVSGGLLDVAAGSSPTKAANNDLQSRGLDAYLSVLSKNQGASAGLPNWFAGVSLWQVNPFEMRPQNVNEFWVAQDFTTYLKPAADVVARYYWQR